MTKRKPLTDAQKAAAKLRQRAWIAANKERVDELRRAGDKRRYEAMKLEGGEKYLDTLARKAGRLRAAKAAMNDEQLKELQAKESARWESRKADPEKYKEILENKRSYVQRVRAQRPEQYEKIKEFKRNWWKNNKAHGLSLVRERQIRLINACPVWADKDRIKRLYVVAARVSEVTGIQHHVDHVIPLRGKLVSGLHVHQNLRVVAYDVNVSKSNHYEV